MDHHADASYAAQIALLTEVLTHSANNHRPQAGDGVPSNNNYVTQSMLSLHLSVYAVCVNISLCHPCKKIDAYVFY